jgi:tyrosine-protein kinase Etk/Wzc
MDTQIDRLKAQRGQFNSKVSRLPDTQQTILRLKRDVEVSNKLYTELLNSAQQLRVSKAGTIGDARVIDAAVLEEARVSPKSALMLGVSLILGLLLSLVIIWVRRTLRVVVEDPDKIEKQLGLPVYATIPHSKAEDNLSRLIKSGKAKGELLAVSQPEDDAVESLRSLRTTIHFALLGASKGSLLITGSSQDIGKSFISKNLGAVLAQSGKRVIIVDADLRKGHIHREFALEREVGVSEFISGEADIETILKPSSVPGLTVITTGQRPPNPSELLMHQRFEDLLEELGRRYDTVIVDAPPILAVSDAAIIGRLTGATLLVARAGQHPIRELEQAVKRLNQAGVKVKGFVFNDMDTARQRYRYGYKGYVYSYKYGKA